MPFISNTADQQKQMLSEIGLSMDDLFADIPTDLMGGPLEIPEGLSEMEIHRRFGGLSKKNATDLTCFLGGGIYDHFCPAAVPAILSRSAPPLRL